jgi:quercetin dioxygenase-like cupin family protein
LIDDDHDGAPTESLRMIEIQTGGSSPQHSHPYEHENFVVEGKGRLLIGDTWYDLGVGDVAFVPAGILHQYVNAGDTTFKFLCGIPVKKLQGQNTAASNNTSSSTIKASC